MKPRLPRRLWLLAMTSLLMISGCLGTVEGQPIPQGQLYFPGVLLKNSPTLYVVNTNLDLQYKTGSISKINLDTQKVEATTLTPSLPGQAVANDSFSLLLTTSQQDNSLAGLRLSYNAPYFLALFSDQKSGLVGYLSLATNEFWDSKRFSIVADQPELQAFTVDSAGKIQITKSFQLASCFDSTQKKYRRIGRLGGVSITQSNVYLLAEFFIDDPTDSNKFTKHVFLIRTPADLVSSGTLCNDKTLKLDITKTEMAQAARGFAISSDEKRAYVLLDENPILLSIDLTTSSILQRVPTCKGPAMIKLSPDTPQSTLAVSCPKSNELVTYNASDLNIFGKHVAANALGGPLDILFDQPPSKKIFVSYQQDHKIGIFEYENSAPNNRSLKFSEWLKLSR